MNKFRNRLCVFGLLLSAILFCLGIFTACTPTEETKNISYAIYVVDDEEHPVENVTVTLRSDGNDVASAPTDAEGKASFELPAKKYDISLSNLPAGYVYTGSTTTDTLGNDITLELTSVDLAYSATVTLLDGTPANGIAVTWTDENGKTYTAKTNADGVASIELQKGTYVVSAEGTIGDKDYYLQTTLTVTENDRSVSFALSVDERIIYTISVITAGGLGLPYCDVLVYDLSDKVRTYTTPIGGVLEIKLSPDEYDFCLDLGGDALNGYWVTDGDAWITLDETNTSHTYNVCSAVIDSEAPNGTYYSIGSIMYDFTVTTYDDSRTLTLSDLLETKKAVVLNFWYADCSNCTLEFPELAAAYEQYKEKLEVIGINPFDEDDYINQFLYTYSSNFTLTFPLVQDYYYLYEMFSVTGYPTTVIIDRYGAVAFYVKGAITDGNEWLELFETYTADDYVQTFTPGLSDSTEEAIEYVKPTEGLAMSSQSEIVNAIVAADYKNAFTFYDAATAGAADAEYSWPWVVSQYDGKSVIVPTNGGKENSLSSKEYSFATLYADVTLEKGQAVAFDFFSSSKESDDICYVVVDGTVMWQISGIADDWSTCYSYIADRAGTYTISLLFFRTSSTGAGDNTTYVGNLRLCSSDEIETETDIIYHASYNLNAEGTGYTGYINAVYNETDGYYHVDAKDGPYLFLDMWGSTNWSSNIPVWYYVCYYNDLSVLDEKYAGLSLTLNYDIDGDGIAENYLNYLTSYARAAQYSDFYGLVPVDETLRAVLQCFVEEVGETLGVATHENEWLEACKYVIRYGSDNEIGNPILGLMMNTAIEAQIGVNHFSLQTEMAAVGTLIYRFVPEESGVYYIYSENAAESNPMGAQAWLYDGNGIENGLIAYSDNEIHLRSNGAYDDDFMIYAYLEAGVTYYLSCGFHSTGGTGEYDFYIEYKGEEYETLTAASLGYYTYELDDDGNMKTDDNGNLILILAGAVKYELIGDYYYAINADGSTALLYVDFTYITRMYNQTSLETLLGEKIVVGYRTDGKGNYLYDDDGNLIPIYPFDLRYDTAYFWDDENDDYAYDENGNVVYFSLTLEGEYCLNYVETMRNYLEQAEENDGLLAASKELVDILKMFFYIRSGDYFKDDLKDGEASYEVNVSPDELGDEWLSFCWYYKKYKAKTQA